MNSTSENPKQQTSTPESSDKWQSLSRTADQDRGAMIIENEDEDYKRLRTDAYLESEQGQSELRLEKTFDRMAENLDAMVEAGEISSEARDKILDEQMTIVIDAIDEHRADFEEAKKKELISRLMGDYQAIAEKKKAEEKPEEPKPEEPKEAEPEAPAKQQPSPSEGATSAASSENDQQDYTVSYNFGDLEWGNEGTRSTNKPASPEGAQGGTSQEPQASTEAQKGAQSTGEPAPVANPPIDPEVEKLQQQEREKLLKQHISELLYENAQKLVGKDGETGNKKVASKYIGLELDELDAQIAEIDQILTEHGQQTSPTSTQAPAQPASRVKYYQGNGLGATTTVSEKSPAGTSVDKLRQYIAENSIGGIGGAGILTETAPLSEITRAKYAIWWRNLSASQKDEVLKYLKDTKKISNLPYGRGFRDWLSETQTAGAAA